MYKNSSVICVKYCKMMKKIVNYCAKMWKYYLIIKSQRLTNKGFSGILSEAKLI